MSVARRGGNGTMLNQVKLALLVFFHPRSPAAVYSHPLSLPTNIFARLLNVWLALADRFSRRRATTCNVCGRASWRFGYATAISVHAFRPNEICLRCQSNHRTRTLVRLLSERVDFSRREMTVADVGAAKCTRRYFERFPKVTYLTVDRYKDSDVVSDITDIQLRDASVDVVICCHTLEHVRDYQSAIRELYRVLAPGGVSIIAVPQTEHLTQSRRKRDDTFYGYGHLWEFGADFVGTLTDAGFRVETLVLPPSPGGRTGEFLSYHIGRKGRGDGSG
jgi:SAM-dependent methyltransferase